MITLKKRVNPSWWYSNDIEALIKKWRTAKQRIKTKRNSIRLVSLTMILTVYLGLFIRQK
jgi:hypothetical protein